MLFCLNLLVLELSAVDLTIYIRFGENVTYNEIYGSVAQSAWA